jgi:hypothetical protein
MTGAVSSRRTVRRPQAKTRLLHDAIMAVAARFTRLRMPRSTRAATRPAHASSPTTRVMRGMGALRSAPQAPPRRASGLTPSHCGCDMACRLRAGQV